VAATTPAARAAQQATRTIPIVLTLVTDPVDGGLAVSLARPGGNVTGLSLMHPDISGKRLALLKEVVPTVSRVGVLWSASTPSYSRILHETEAAARALGVQLQIIEVRGATALDSAFSTLVKDHAGAVLVLPDPMFRNHLQRIVGLAAKNQVPALYWSRDLVDAGGLMSYGANLPETFRQAAAFVAKILKGAKPAELPIEQPAKLELVINLKAAKTLGLAMPPSLLLQADQVIE
jgi:putative ABC transport system substrate-binding protein